MGFNNTITIISNKNELIEQISSKLVLLRDLDKVINTPVKGALEFLKIQIPNVIMLHCFKNDSDALALVKSIRADEILKNIPILFLDENCTREVVIEAFDSGINDLLNCPALDYELLIRTIWCIQKNEINTQNETSLDFMKSLGIIENENRIYSQKYSEEFIKSQINNILKYRTNAALMLLTQDRKRSEQKEASEFLNIVKKSVRLNDSIAVKEDNQYYVLLPKTKLNGVYSVFERINQNLGNNSGANAAVIEIKGQNFEEIKELLQNSLNKAKDDTNSLIVASRVFPKELTNVNLAKLKNAAEEKKMQQVRASAPAPLPLPAPSPAPVKKDIPIRDDGSAKLYQQAYKQKCKIVFEPVFEKYKSRIEHNVKEAQAQYEINLDKTKFVMYKNNVRASLRITYGGMYKVKIDTAFVCADVTKGTNSIVLDLIQVNFQKLSQLLEELYVEFKNYAKIPD